MSARTGVLAVAVGAVLALAGCHRAADSSATVSPGAGNPATAATPSAADTPTDRAAAVAARPGVVGSAGGSGDTGQQAAATPGQGLQGGMGAGPASSGASGSGSAIPDGGPQLTHKSATGTK